MQGTLSLFDDLDFGHPKKNDNPENTAPKSNLEPNPNDINESSIDENQDQSNKNDQNIDKTIEPNPSELIEPIAPVTPNEVKNTETASLSSALSQNNQPAALNKNQSTEDFLNSLDAILADNSFLNPSQTSEEKIDITNDLSQDNQSEKNPNEEFYINQPSNVQQESTNDGNIEEEIHEHNLPLDTIRDVELKNEVQFSKDIEETSSAEKTINLDDEVTIHSKSNKLDDVTNQEISSTELSEVNTNKSESLESPTSLDFDLSKYIVNPEWVINPQDLPKNTIKQTEALEEHPVKIIEPTSDQDTIDNHHTYSGQTSNDISIVEEEVIDLDEQNSNIELSIQEEVNEHLAKAREETALLDSDNILDNIDIVTESVQISEYVPNDIPESEISEKDNTDDNLKTSTKVKRNNLGIKAKAKKPVVSSFDIPTDKMYFSISEVSKMFQLNISHIRHWTTQFNIKVRTNKKGDRLYNHQNIQELQAIYQLMKVEGMTLSGTKKRLKQKDAILMEFDAQKNEPNNIPNDRELPTPQTLTEETIQKLKALKEQLIVFAQNI